MMRSTLRARRALMAAGTIGLLAIAVAAAPASAATSPSAQASELIASVFPGATTALVPDVDSPGGVQLQIALPATATGPLGTAPTSLSDPAAPAPFGSTSTPAPYSQTAFRPAAIPTAGQPADAARQFRSANIGWALDVATATLAQTQPDLTSYQATIAGQVADDTDELQGVIRLAPGVDPLGPSAEPPAPDDDLDGAAAGDDTTATGPELQGTFPNLDSITPDQALAQAQTSVTTLRAGLPDGQLTDAQASVVPIAGSQQFAISVDLTVKSIAAVSDELGDLVHGLDTGLVGDQSATVEGLVVTVHDASGAAVSSFSAPRAQTGNLLATENVELGNELPITLPFVSTTGGPNALSTLFSSAVTSSEPATPGTD